MSVVSGVFFFDGRPGSSPILFDGRLDNREELLDRLENELRDDLSDAALAHAAYRKHGTAGLVHLVGDWSLAIWDGSRRAVILASDFAGVRPLYYSTDGDRVACSGDLQALVELAEADSLDDDYIAAMAAFGAVPHRTPYRGISSTPPGHAVTITKDGISIKAFWQPPIANRIRYRNQAEYGEHLLALLQEAVRCRLRADQRVLMELSGGLDSSSLVCMARQLRENGEFPNSRVVTLSHEYPGSRDTRFFPAVEEFCGFESIHVPIAGLPFVTARDPGQSAPAFWQSLHSHTAGIARQSGAGTLITGRFGDLVMGNWWDDSVQVAGLLREGRTGPALSQALEWSKALRKPIWGILWRAMLANLPARLAPTSLYGDDESNIVSSKEDSLTPALRERLRSMPRFLSRTWTQAAPERRRRLRQMTETLELRTLMTPEPLRSLSYTHPYTHRPLVEFMLSIPPDVVCGPGRPRRLMRASFEGLWPPALKRRQSKDSYASLFLESLRPLALVLLNRAPRLQLVERGYIELDSFKKRLENLTHSLECNESQLRQIMLLELWLENQESRAPESCPIPA